MSKRKGPAAESGTAAAEEYGVGELIHLLPRARIVNRTAWLVEQCHDLRVIHVGFTDQGFAGLHKREN